MRIERRAPEQRIIVNEKTGRKVIQLTDSSEASMHSYYDLCPWSADGKRIVFCSYDKEWTRTIVYVMEVDSGAIRQIGESEYVDTQSGVLQQWVGDSRRVAYQHKEGEALSVAIVDTDTGHVEKIPGEIRMISPDGRRVASDTDSFDRDCEGIVISDLTGGESRLIVSANQAIAAHPRSGEVAAAEVRFKHTKWAPDSSRLMFVMHNEGWENGRYVSPTIKDVFTVRPDGSDLRHACNFKRGNHPIWHPDSTRILLNNRNSHEDMQLQLVEEATGALEIIPYFRGSGHPSFSPDGTRVLVDVVSGVFDAIGQIYCVNVVNGEVELLVEVPVNNHGNFRQRGTHLHPVWSRDGKQVLINSDQTGHSELHLITLES